MYFGELGRPENARPRGDFKVARNWRYNWLDEMWSYRVRVGRQIRWFVRSVVRRVWRLDIHPVVVRRGSSPLRRQFAFDCDAVEPRRARRPRLFALKVNGGGDESLSSFVGLFFRSRRRFANRGKKERQRLAISGSLCSRNLSIASKRQSWARLLDFC